MPDNRSRDTVQKYVADMVALESHIEEALDSQVSKVTEPPKAVQVIRRFHDTVKQQRDALKAHLETLGGDPAHPLKEAVASVAGMAAGLIDKVRPETAATKNLRDDYTAFNHAAVGYHLLYGTALMLGHPQTVAIAERHHRAYTDMIQDINQIILSVVASELKRDGHVVDEMAMDRATARMNEDWKSTAPSSGTTGDVGRTTGPGLGGTAG